MIKGTRYHLNNKLIYTWELNYFLSLNLNMQLAKRELQCLSHFYII